MNYDRQLAILSLLEKESLSMEILVARLQLTGFDVTERTVQRDLNEDMVQTGIPIEYKSRQYSLQLNLDYYLALSKLIHNYFEDTMRVYVYKDVTTKSIQNAIGQHKRPASFFMKICEALLNSKEISFLYKPQTREVAEKMAIKKNRYQKGLPVNIIPHGLVFSKDTVLIGGENHYFEKPMYRHYDLRGIAEITLRQAKRKLLKINLDEEYRNSVDVWHGGDTYCLVIRETPPAEPEKTRAYERTVNGEKEILAEILASDERLKIINPPDQLVQKARELKYPESIFVFE